MKQDGTFRFMDQKVEEAQRLGCGAAQSRHRGWVPTVLVRPGVGCQEFHEEA